MKLSLIIQYLIITIALSGLSACENNPTISTNGEKLIGRYHENTDIAVFLGVPFAEPPIGDLRWQEPVPLKEKLTNRLTKEFAAACIQSPRILDWYRDMAEIFGSPRDVFPDLKTDEDCLYLNIWTPSPNSKSKLPVMVYVHGGSNNSGWSYEPNYHGHSLAKKNVVVVSIAYRLGVFGFFSHPEINTNQPSANFGLWDQIAALKWINKYIENFGGDPRNVTVFGESAGAQDILALIFSKQAKGLFQKVILQSNAGFGMKEDSSTLKKERIRGEEYSKAMGDEKPLSLEELRKIDANTILNRYESIFPDYYHSPAFDNHLLSKLTWDSIMDSEFNDIKLIIGSNADETYAWISPTVTSKDVASHAEEIYKDQSKQALKAVETEDDPRRAIDRLYTAKGLMCPSQFLANQINSNNGKAWVYYFDRVRDGEAGSNENVRAYHGAELPYVFDTHDPWMTTTEKDIALTKILTDYWTQFAKTGNPNAKHLPNWSAFDISKKSVQKFGNYVGTINSPEPILCDLFFKNATF